MYPRPPIVEALVEVGLAVAVPRQVHLFQEHFPDMSDDEATPAHEAPRYLVSGDGLSVIGCYDDGFSTHVLEPYPGWEALRALAEAATRAAAPHAAPGPLGRLGVRYIDHIAIPLAGGTQWDDYFTCLPSRPASMPAALAGLGIELLAEDEATIAHLSIRSSQDEPATVMYDLLVRSAHPARFHTVEEWMTELDRLHARQRRIFEDSITDALRETFQ